VRRITIGILFLLFVGCPGSVAWQSQRIGATEAEAKRNNENMMLLNIGQSKEEILGIMGAPAKREAYKLDAERVVEFWFYRTSGWSMRDMGDMDYQFTPMAIEDDKLVGWGRNYYDTVVRSAVELLIK
jgi:hypothetical protein